MALPGTATELYTADQRRRRDASAWTIVQAVLAPLQFLAFLVSLALMLRWLATGDGYAAATASVVVKTGVLYLIMATGAVWEHDVFGRYLFAPAFLWEDVVSTGVMALHTAYCTALFSHALTPPALIALALAAYAGYCINAAQYVFKFRLARRTAPVPA